VYPTAARDWAQTIIALVSGMHPVEDVVANASTVADLAIHATADVWLSAMLPVGARVSFDAPLRLTDALAAAGAAATSGATAGRFSFANALTAAGVRFAGAAAWPSSLGGLASYLGLRTAAVRLPVDPTADLLLAADYERSDGGSSGGGNSGGGGSCSCGNSTSSGGSSSSSSSSYAAYAAAAALDPASLVSPSQRVGRQRPAVAQRHRWRPAVVQDGGRPAVAGGRVLAA
jgi:uncharacterized membrane protein YgcG